MHCLHDPEVTRISDGCVVGSILLLLLAVQLLLDGPQVHHHMPRMLIHVSMLATDVSQDASVTLDWLRAGWRGLSDQISSFTFVEVTRAELLQDGGVDAPLRMVPGVGGGIGLDEKLVYRKAVTNGTAP